MFKRTSNWEYRASVIGGEVGELEGMLSLMREEKELLVEKHANVKMAARKLEEEKVKIGNDLMERPMKRKKNKVTEVEEVEEK